MAGSDSMDQLNAVIDELDGFYMELKAMQGLPSPKKVPAETIGSTAVSSKENTPLPLHMSDSTSTNSKPHLPNYSYHSHNPVAGNLLTSFESRDDVFTEDSKRMSYQDDDGIYSIPTSRFLHLEVDQEPLDMQKNFASNRQVETSYNVNVNSAASNEPIHDVIPFHYNTTERLPYNSQSIKQPGLSFEHTVSASVYPLPSPTYSLQPNYSTSHLDDVLYSDYDEVPTHEDFPDYDEVPTTPVQVNYTLNNTLPYKRNDEKTQQDISTTVRYTQICRSPTKKLDVKPEINESNSRPQDPPNSANDDELSEIYQVPRRGTFRNAELVTEPNSNEETQVRRTSQFPREPIVMVIGETQSDCQRKKNKCVCCPCFGICMSILIVIATALLIFAVIVYVYIGLTNDERLSESLAGSQNENNNNNIINTLDATTTSSTISTSNTTLSS